MTARERAQQAAIPLSKKAFAFFDSLRAAADNPPRPCVRRFRYCAASSARRTSSIVGIASAAPGRATDSAAAIDAQRMASRRS